MFELGIEHQEHCDGHYPWYDIYDICPRLVSQSLRQSIRTGEPTPTSGPEESTVQIDVEQIHLEGVSLRVYDCAGQVIVLQLSPSRSVV